MLMQKIANALNNVLTFFLLVNKIMCSYSSVFNVKFRLLNKYGVGPYTHCYEQFVCLLVFISGFRKWTTQKEYSILCWSRNILLFFFNTVILMFLKTHTMLAFSGGLSIFSTKPDWSQDTEFQTFMAGYFIRTWICVQYGATKTSL